MITTIPHVGEIPMQKVMAVNPRLQMRQRHLERLERRVPQALFQFSQFPGRPTAPEVADQPRDGRSPISASRPMRLKAEPMIPIRISRDSTDAGSVESRTADSTAWISGGKLPVCLTPPTLCRWLADCAATGNAWTH